MSSCDKLLSFKDSLLLKIKKHEKYQICVMDLISHQGITLIVFSRPAIQLDCLFDVYMFIPFHLLYLSIVSVA